MSCDVRNKNEHPKRTSTPELTVKYKSSKKKRNGEQEISNVKSKRKLFREPF